MPVISLPVPNNPATENVWGTQVNVAINTINNAVDSHTNAISEVIGDLDEKLNITDAPELIRDTMGTALVAGANVTITPNDGANTITIAASGGGGGGSAAWGGITGTLSDQTDLNNRLDAIETGLTERIVSFSDPNADRIVFWDDSAGDYLPLAAVAPLSIAGTNLSVAAASDTVAGVVELATTAEATTGTDTTRAITAAGLKTVADTKAALSHTHTASQITDFSSAVTTVMSGASTFIRTTGAQSMAGVKTFTDIPVVPDASFTSAKISASGTPSSTTFLRGDGQWATPAGGGGGGTGDVVGPASATNNNIAVFDTTTGKLIKDGGVAVSGLMASNAALTALGAVATNGSLHRTAANTYASRTLTGSTYIAVTNGDGVSGNPTIAIQSTIPVANGGSGRATATTAYGLIAAGTTATGAQQTISPGTSGQFLKSAGAAALASFSAIAQSDVTNLTTDLAAKAPLASPTFTGVPAAPTATAGTNTTQVATTAFVTAATPAASATVSGLVELATTAEASTGTDTVRAVTPAGLATAWGARVTNGDILVVDDLSDPAVAGTPAYSIVAVY